MPRIDPKQLLDTLRPLITASGGIKGEGEVVKLAQLMQRFSKKLVSKVIYVQILKSTEGALLDAFLGEKGWELLNAWFSDAIRNQNWELCQEMIQLFSDCPISAERLKENVADNHAPRLINQLRQEPTVDENIRLVYLLLPFRQGNQQLRKIKPAKVMFVFRRVLCQCCDESCCQIMMSLPTPIPPKLSTKRTCSKSMLNSLDVCRFDWHSIREFLAEDVHDVTLLKGLDVLNEVFIFILFTCRRRDF